MTTSQKIGLVDDEDLVRFATRTLLNFSGYEVEEFPSAEALLEAESLSDLRCLIIDFRLPGLSGLDLLRELEERNVGVPSIVVSGFTSETDVEELTAAGAAEILDKPMHAKDLIAKVAHVIEEAEQR